MSLENPDLTTRQSALCFLQNPVIAASGTFGYGLEIEPLVDLNLLGALVVKGLSLKPMAGNPPPRIVETPGGMLNAIGLANIGLEAFFRDKLPKLRKYTTPIIVNIYGHHTEEYGELASAFRGVGRGCRPGGEHLLPERGMRRHGFRDRPGRLGAGDGNGGQEHGQTRDREALSQCDGHQEPWQRPSKGPGPMRCRSSTP